MNLLAKLTKVMGENFSKVFGISNAFQAQALWYAVSKQAAKIKSLQGIFGEGLQKIAEKYPTVAEQLTNIFVELRPSKKQTKLGIEFAELNPKEIEAFQKIVGAFPEIQEHLPEAFRQNRKVIITLPQNFLEKSLTKEEQEIFKSLGQAPKDLSLKLITANPPQYKQFKEAATVARTSEMLWMLKEVGDIDKILAGEVPTGITKLDEVLKEQILKPLFQIAEKGPGNWNFGAIHNVLSKASEEIFGEASYGNIQKLSRMIGTLYTEAGSEHAMLVGTYFRQIGTAYEVGPEKALEQLNGISQRFFGLLSNPETISYLSTESINFSKHLGALAGVIAKSAQENPELANITKALALLTKEAKSPIDLAKRIVKSDVYKKVSNFAGLLSISEIDTTKTAKNMLFSAYVASSLPQEMRLGTLTERLALLPHEIVTDFEEVIKGTFYSPWLKEDAKLENLLVRKKIDLKFSAQLPKMPEPGAKSRLLPPYLVFGRSRKQLIEASYQALTHYTGSELRNVFTDVLPRPIEQLAATEERFPSKLGLIKKMSGMILYTGKEPINERRWPVAELMQKMFEEAEATKRMYLSNIRAMRRISSTSEEFQKLIAQTENLKLETTQEILNKETRKVITVNDVLEEHIREHLEIDPVKLNLAKMQALSAEKISKTPPKSLSEVVNEQEIIQETQEKLSREKIIFENKEKLSEQPQPPKEPPAEEIKEEIKQETFEEAAQENSEHINEQAKHEEFKQETFTEQPSESPKDEPPKDEIRQEQETEQQEQQRTSMFEMLKNWGNQHKRSLAITGASVAGLMTIGGLTRAHHRKKLADVQASLYHTMRINYAEMQNFRPSPITMTSYQYTPQHEGYHNGYEIYGVPQTTYKSRSAF